MGVVGNFSQEKLIVGLLFAKEEQAEEAKKLLVMEFGEIDYIGAISSFSDHSRYYDKEMNAAVFRQFFSFHTLVDPSRLPEIKLRTNQLEEQFMQEGLRPINIDPGLINTGRLVLATTKCASHRIALSQGIYGELTLFFSLKQWQIFPWTYPDFRTPETQEILGNIRKIYRGQMREL